VVVTMAGGAARRGMLVVPAAPGLVVGVLRGGRRAGAVLLVLLLVERGGGRGTARCWGDTVRRVGLVLVLVLATVASLSFHYALLSYCSCTGGAGVA